LETIHRVFLEDAPLQISKLREALEANDAAVAERTAHTIKGASANIGATAMRERASKMELAARDGDLDQVGSLLDGLQEEFERVRTAIQGRAEPRGPRF
ncbi:MAG TPA: Hpt domain-containing protein, partial [Sumerlaeia bacterium]|nr:Hpt domain-containing protein [Sumerlaeia bacterium]